MAIYRILEQWFAASVRMVLSRSFASVVMQTKADSRGYNFAESAPSQMPDRTRGVFCDVSPNLRRACVWDSDRGCSVIAC
jgi:hypothetical protein